MDRYRFLELTRVTPRHFEHPDFGDVCMCPCHWDGVSGHHCSCFISCCERPQVKYADEDANLDLVRFGKIIMDMRIDVKGKK